GYKVYLGESAGGPLGAGAQIVEPDDRAVEEEIRRVGPLSAVPLGDAGTKLGNEPVRSYLEGAVSVVDPDTPRELTVAYTPLHGVGGGCFVESLDRAGFPAPDDVSDQFAPDPDFPTVAFPIPEEPQALSRLLELAAAAG